MKKKSLYISSILITSTLLIGMAFFHKPLSLVKSDDVPYSLLLNNNQKITTSSTSSEEEIEGNIFTTKNNPIKVRGYNIKNNLSGWQTLLPGGYIYNPVNSRISGIKSIKFSANTSVSLEIHYGYSLNNQQIIYSFADTLENNVEYLFTDKSPSYFYIKNNNDAEVAINSLNIGYSCEEEAYPYNNLKVLMIGNSFADDTVYYSARVANGFGINLEIYDAYIAGCTIDTHYSNLQSGATSYSMRSMNGETWSYQNEKSLTDIINYKDWDIITFQQASGSIGRSDSYSNLTNLVNGVRSIVGNHPKFYWYQTWAYDADYSDYYDYFSYFNNDQMAMFDAIINCYNTKVKPLNLFEKTISAGTAVQNLRTSYMGDTFTRDGKHMSSVHGRYLLANNFISNIFEIDLDISNNSYLPFDVNPSYMTVVKEAVRNARLHPLEVTNSKFKDWELGQYDLTNYTEIDAELVGCSFYNSTDANDYNKRICNTSGASNKYVTTKRFTPSTLPVGSFVFCKEPFGYRPEAWINDAVQSTRPDERYDNVLEITSNFWQGYQYRAFNIFKCGKATLSGEYINEQYDEIFDGFHIYVPNASLGTIKVKGQNDYYNSDKTLFNNNGLDIDNYHRLHLDPIIGFYKCDSYYYFMNSHVDDTAKRFVCTRPFFSANNDLPENTVLIVDFGYRWRSDCWKEKATYSPRPDNVTTNFTILDSNFLGNFRVRTFNISTTSSAYVYQNFIERMNHFRIYLPN